MVSIVARSLTGGMIWGSRVLSIGGWVILRRLGGVTGPRLVISAAANTVNRSRSLVSHTAGYRDFGNLSRWNLLSNLKIAPSGMVSSDDEPADCFDVALVPHVLHTPR